MGAADSSEAGSPEDDSGGTAADARAARIARADAEEEDEEAWLTKPGGLDVRRAVAALRVNVRSDKAYARALEALLLYATNAAGGDERCRVVRRSNALFHARLGALRGGLRCMFALGFSPVEWRGDRYLAMVAPPKGLAEMRVTLTQAFQKAAGGKGFSVISLRERESLEVVHGAGQRKADFLQGSPHPPSLPY